MKKVAQSPKSSKTPRPSTPPPSTKRTKDTTDVDAPIPFRPTEQTRARPNRTDAASLTASTTLADLLSRHPGPTYPPTWTMLVYVSRDLLDTAMEGATFEDTFPDPEEAAYSRRLLAAAASLSAQALVDFDLKHPTKAVAS